MLIAIPSSGRPGNVALMKPQVPDAVWFVPEDEVAAYEAEGADARGLGSRESAAKVRNAILDRAGPRTVAMVDDDVLDVKLVNEDGAVLEWRLIWALENMLARLDGTDFHLIGVAPTSNAYFSKRPTSTNLFARAGVWVIKPSPLRMDENLRVKEDYDFNLQHLESFGGWLRADDILVTVRQRSAVGGCAPLRADGADAQAVDYLLAKWPGLIKPHPTRENEVSLRVPKRRNAS